MPSRLAAQGGEIRAELSTVQAIQPHALINVQALPASYRTLVDPPTHSVRPGDAIVALRELFNPERRGAAPLTLARSGHWDDSVGFSPLPAARSVAAR